MSPGDQWHRRLASGLVGITLGLLIIILALLAPIILTGVSWASTEEFVFLVFGGVVALVGLAQAIRTTMALRREIPRS